MNKLKHLTIKQKKEVNRLYKQGLTAYGIAKVMKKNVSTISHYLSQAIISAVLNKDITKSI